MQSPFDMEHLYRWRSEELAREAAAERLAQLLRRPTLRSRLAAVLYALAARLDTSAQPVRQRPAQSLPLNGTTSY